MLFTKKHKKPNKCLNFGCLFVFCFLFCFVLFFWGGGAGGGGGEGEREVYGTYRISI